MIEQFLKDAWAGLGELKPGQAVLVTGFVGALTLMVGHITNAWLASRRDNRIDRVHRRRIEAAFLAELEVVVLNFKTSADRIKLLNGSVEDNGKVFVPRCKFLMPLRGDITKSMLHLNRRQIHTVIHTYDSVDGFDTWLDFNFAKKDILEEKGARALIDTDNSRRAVMLKRIESSCTYLECQIFRFKLDSLLHRDRWLRLPIMVIYYAPKRIGELRALAKLAKAKDKNASSAEKS